MPANSLSMRKIKEVLRLKWANNLSDRKVTQSCNISRPAVVSYVEQAKLAGLSWPLPDELTDAQLERLLFPAQPKEADRDRVIPDWFVIQGFLNMQGFFHKETFMRDEGWGDALFAREGIGDVDIIQ